MFRLAHKEFLWLYILIPAMIIIFILMIRWKKNALKKFGEMSIIENLFPGISRSVMYAKFFLFITAFSFLTFSLCAPQAGTKLEEVKRKGVDIMIALDVSNSMNAEDIKPSRLERAKQAIYRLIDGLDGDRIGLIVFAGQPYVQLPVTTDYGAAKLFLQSVNSQMVPVQGTDIGSAIELCMKSVDDTLSKNTAIIIITDGENLEEDAVKAAKKAAAKGLAVYTVGFGSANGAPIPVSNNSKGGYLQDKEGNTVVTKLDEVMLQKIAAAGKGKFIRATTSDDGLNLILKAIGSIEERTFGALLFTDYKDQFQYFLLAALIFLIFEFMLTERKSEWVRQMKLFDEKKALHK